MDLNAAEYRRSENASKIETEDAALIQSRITGIKFIQLLVELKSPKLSVNPLGESVRPLEHVELFEQLLPYLGIDLQRGHNGVDHYLER